MFDSTPQNLPTGGKSMLDNINPGVKDSSPPVASAPKIPPAPAASAPRPAVSSAPAEIDDIFSDTKEAPPAPRVTPTSSPPPVGRVPLSAKMTEETTVETPRQGFKKILITIGLVVLVAGLLSTGGYWAYNSFLKPKPLSPMLNLNAGGESSAVPETPGEAAPETTQPVQEAAQPAFIDSDNDGLTDTEEQTLGTAANNPDTDGDGLFDGEESKVYKTDPLNPDTDGDTFKDGDEVKNGYDPKGPGKLIRIPAGQ